MSDYFDADYFDGTYFDAPDQEAPAAGRGGGRAVPPPQRLPSLPDADADEAFLLVL